MVLIPPMVVLRFVSMEYGPQCAVINLMKMMQELSADSLDTTLKVHLECASVYMCVLYILYMCVLYILYMCYISYTCVYSCTFVSFASQASCISVKGCVECCCRFIKSTPEGKAL